MLKKKYPFYLANKPEMPNTDLKVVDKYTGKIATHVAVADEHTIDKAIEAAHKSVEAL
ncbi:MAG: aldehyde dehydrogenase, partial [Deltaproteobacteria bacterium]|nr:aldehyde dehydrogenase [Deltaproteobacteria bacterium]